MGFINQNRGVTVDLCSRVFLYRPINAVCLLLSATITMLMTTTDSAVLSSVETGLKIITIILLTIIIIFYISFE